MLQIRMGWAGGRGVWVVGGGGLCMLSVCEKLITHLDASHFSVVIVTSAETWQIHVPLYLVIHAISRLI